MAIALSGTSPALVTETSDGTATTAAFSPPAQSLLVACCAAADDTSAPTVSGGGLTWTSRIARDASSHWASIWTAPCPAGATNIQITLTSLGLFGFFASALKVDVYTGADLTSPVGASGQGSSTTNSGPISAYTSTVLESRGVAVALDGAQLGVPSSTDDEAAFDLANLTGMTIRKAANTASLSGVQFDLDAAGSGTPDWQWVALEIVPPVIPFLAGVGRMVGQAVNRASFY